MIIKKGKNEKALIALVDDEVDITELVAEELSSDYEVRQFNNPQKFIEAMKMKEFKPAVLVIDLKMPVINGLEVLKQINEMNASVPTILFSGHLEKDDAISALELGVIHVIEKPIDIHIVHEIVNDSIIDSELLNTRIEIRELTKKVKEIYSMLRLAVTHYVSPEIVDKIFLSHSAKNENFDDLLEALEQKLEFLLREENLLSKMKQTQLKVALEKQAQRAS